MTPLDSALIFADFASAQTRSRQMASRMNCSGITQFWYETIQLTDNRGIIVVTPGNGPYGTKPGPTALSQLTPAEIAALVPYATVQALLPVVPPIV